MKYIDAEKLTRLLDAKYKDFMGKAKIEGYTTLQYQYMADGIDIAGQLIDSLQQEQPEVFDTMAFQKGVAEGRRLEREDALTIADIEKLHTFLYAVKNNKQGAFTFTRLTDEQYEEVLRMFNNARKKE